MIAALSAMLLAAAAADGAGTPPEATLAATQIGFAPELRKRFTSTAPFRSFRVVREPGGAVAYEGKEPARELRSRVLGPGATAWIGDFSALREPGRYRIVADNGMSSHPFDVGRDVFDAPLRAIERFLYFQRAFTAITPRHAEGPWTHPSDAGSAPAGVVKGWHDAGDLSLYNASTVVATFWLLEAYSDFRPGADDTNIPESGNGVPDILDEARWGLEWLLSVQDAGSGGFRNSTCQTQAGRYGTNLPQSVPRYKNGEVGTIPTARAVGVLAYASTLFRPFDGAFAQRCLLAARSGYRYLDARRGEESDGATCPSYRSNEEHETGRHVRMFAAAGMLLATGEPRFRDDFERSYEELTYIPDFNKMNGFAAMLYLRAPAGTSERKEALRERFRVLADSALADGEAHPFEWATYYYWGSLSNGFHRTVFNAKACIEDAARTDDCEQALADVHYLFGRNSARQAYVSGLRGVTRGMSGAFHEWLKALDASPHDFPGMIAGGPNEFPDPNDRSYPHSKPFPTWGYWGDPRFPRNPSTPIDARHTDNDSWSTNEVAVNWQGAALYAVHFAQWMAKGRPAVPAR